MIILLIGRRMWKKNNFFSCHQCIVWHWPWQNNSWKMISSAPISHFFFCFPQRWKNRNRTCSEIHSSERVPRGQEFIGTPNPCHPNWWEISGQFYDPIQTVKRKGDCGVCSRRQLSQVCGPLEWEKRGMVCPLAIENEWLRTEQKSCSLSAIWVDGPRWRWNWGNKLLVSLLDKVRGTYCECANNT